jgi:GNAT superfamily N-acetyltransferase
MPDLLVKLYDLPACSHILEQLAGNGIEVRRALAAEKIVVAKWVEKHFTPAWASECEIAFSRQPVACTIAMRDEMIVGFCCHGVACPDFLGPLGVLPEWRKHNVGKAMLLTSLEALRAQGFAYAIIGRAGPITFFEKSVGAMVIADSEPGSYRGMLRESSSD